MSIQTKTGRDKLTVKKRLGRAAGKQKDLEIFSN